MTDSSSGRGHVSMHSSIELPHAQSFSHSLAHAASVALGPQWSMRHTVLVVINVLLALMLHRLLMLTPTKHVELFYLYYQPFAPFLVMLWLWGLNVRYFEQLGIANMLSVVVMASASAFLFYCVQGITEAAAIQPPLIYAAMLAILLFPAAVFYQETRRFFATTAWRVITPIRGVSWADFLLADILTSLAKAISDVERAVCVMASGPVMAPAADVCGDASWVIPAGLALPYMWRLAQCLRVHADTGAKPQLWNALKYFTAFPVIAGSAIKYHVSQEAWRGFFKPLWLGAALLNSMFSCYWDFERDWNVSFFSQMRAQRTLLPKPVLPANLQYPRAFYFYLMVSNLVLRLSWTYKLSPHLRRNHSTVLIIVLAEAVRRFQWIFVRVEVELSKIQAAKPELGQLVPAVQPPTAAQQLGMAEREMSKGGFGTGGEGDELDPPPQLRPSPFT